LVDCSGKYLRGVNIFPGQLFSGDSKMSECCCKCHEDNCTVLVSAKAGYCKRHGGEKRMMGEKKVAYRARKELFRDDGRIGIGMGLSRCAKIDAEKRIQAQAQSKENQDPENESWD
jgi:hypothetical protein